MSWVQGSLNRVTYHYPLLDDSQIAALWTIFSNSGMASHRVIIEHVLEHLTSVSGSLDQAPIEPSTMIADMVNALPDNE